MTFESEEVRTTYHSLPIDGQMEVQALEEAVIPFGKHLHLVDLTVGEGADLNLVVRLSSKLQSSPLVD